MVGPHRQRARAGRAAVEIVAGVFDDEADAGVAREVDGELDLGHAADVEGVAGVAAEGAGGGGGGGWEAGAALPEGPHYGGWIFHAGSLSVS